MAIVTSPSLRVAIATDIVPQAVGLLCAIAMTGVFCLFSALGVATLLRVLTLEGWQAAYGALAILAEGLGAVLALEAAMDASVRIGRWAEGAALRWCERLDG